MMKNINITTFVFLFVSTFSQIQSQNFYEEYKNKTLKEFSYSFLEERLEIMKNYSDVSYCIKGEDFTNTVKLPSKESAVITVKITENDIFVFYFLNLYNKQNEKLVISNELLSGLYLVRNGYIEESSIKFFYVERKNKEINSGVKTEEIWFDDRFYFVVINQIDFNKMIFPNKAEIQLKLK